jgi:hypothetical protein
MNRLGFAVRIHPQFYRQLEAEIINRRKHLTFIVRSLHYNGGGVFIEDTGLPAEQSKAL